MFGASDPGRRLTTCSQCRLAAGLYQLDASHPCNVCEAFPKRTWSNLRRFLCDAKARRGRRHWTSAFPHIEAWIATQPASTAASSEPGWEISSFVDSGDDFFDINVIVGTMGVVGNFQVQEPIGVTTVMVDKAMSAPTTALMSMDTATTAQYDLQECQ